MHLIDTHCHLNLLDSFPDPEPEFTACADAGIGIILVGLDPETGRRAVDLAEAHDNVWAIVGRHPNYAHGYGPAELAVYCDLLKHPKVVALGEIGLDFHWDFATRDQQDRALFDQLDLAQEVGSPVVFHCREAYPELLTVLESRPPHPYLFHCFAGDADDARRAIALDAYFGVDGPITYKKADGLRTVVSNLPKNRIVLETDSPYMAPVPHRGKPNRPSYLPLIAEGLAAVWGETPEATAFQTTENARAFFGIHSSNSDETSRT